MELFDQRTFNGRRNPSMVHKLRCVNPGNRTGNTFAVTIPSAIANNFPNTYFRITQDGTTLILESGAKFTAAEVTKKKDNSFNGLRMIINKYGNPEWIK
jgi:virulence-associated protein VagC